MQYALISYALQPILAQMGERPSPVRQKLSTLISWWHRPWLP